MFTGLIRSSFSVILTSLASQPMRLYIGQTFSGFGHLNLFTLHNAIAKANNKLFDEINFLTKIEIRKSLSEE